MGEEGYRDLKTFEDEKNMRMTKSYLKGRLRVMRPKRMGRTRQPWMKRPRRTVKK